MTPARHRPDPFLTASLVVLFAALVVSLYLAYQDVACVVQYVPDDTYYYLQWAWNLTHGHGPTFDTMTPTNGVQPLWAGLLLPLAKVSASKDHLLRLALLVNALISLLAGALIVRLLHTYRSPAAGLTAALLYTAFLGNAVFMSGMELGVSLLGFALYLTWLAAMVRRVAGGDRLETRHCLVGAVCVLVLGFARPDLNLYGLAGAALLWLLASRREARPTLGQLAVVYAPVFVLLLVYVRINQATFGTAMPISGQVKLWCQEQMYATAYGGRNTLGYLLGYVAPRVPLRLIKIVEQAALRSGTLPRLAARLSSASSVHWLAFYFGGAILGWATGFTVSWLERRRETGGRWIAILSRLPSGATAVFAAGLITLLPLIGLGLAGRHAGTGSRPADLALSLAVALAWAVVGGQAGWRQRRLEVGWVGWIGLTLWCVAVARITVLVSGIGYWTSYCMWYYGAETLLVIATLSWLLDTALQRRTGPWRTGPWVHLLVGLILIVTAWSDIGGVVARYHRGDPPGGTARRREIALWIADHTPPDALLGSFNAGAIGYFSDRRVINLDGLMNDLAYLEHLKAGKPIADYLDRRGVEYVFDYDWPRGWDPGESPPEVWHDLPTGRLDEVRSWPMKGKVHYRLFRWRPPDEE